MSVRRFLALAALGLLATAPVGAPAAAAGASAAPVCTECVKADMEVLAGDDLRGRQCGTDDEARAAAYVADRLKAAGVNPAFGDGYLQKVGLVTPTVAAQPTLDLSLGKAALRWTHGREFVIAGEPRAVQGRLVRVTDADLAGETPRVDGAVVFYDPADPEAKSTPALKRLFKAGAVAVLLPAGKATTARWERLSGVPEMDTQVQDAPADACPDCLGERLFLTADAAAALRGADVRETARLSVIAGQPRKRTTRNVVGVLHGSAPDADRNAVLLSAHYDHLGVRGGVIFHGADDDASGTAAVLEFARMLGKGERPKRTVYFALFGCEEEGGLGATYYRAHPPTPLTDLALNLEFEMIGLRDPKMDTLMLTGWERSDLGPTLAAQGAKVGPDPYPEQHFFQRSDNYQLALKGVVAQTVSGWAVTPTYHTAQDDLAHVDLGFMVETIGSLAGPVRWLVDGEFRPKWNDGMRPTRTAAP